MKPSIEQLVRRVKKTEHGFTDIKRAAGEIALRTSDTAAIKAARKLFTSEVHQARMLATFIFGILATRSKQCLNFLRTRVSTDVDWRVQEILAQAFDRFCADVGYDKAVPAIKQWLEDTNPNVRRAASEGLRIWTARPFFRDHPDVAINLLSSLHADGKRIRSKVCRKCFA